MTHIDMITRKLSYNGLQFTQLRRSRKLSRDRRTQLLLAKVQRYCISFIGPSPLLTEEEEDSLVFYLTHVADRGFPIPQSMLKAFVRAIVHESRRETDLNMETSPSNNWVRRFLKRNPVLKVETPEPQERDKARMSNWTVMMQYFSLLASTVASLGLSVKPSQNFSCDENEFSGKERSRQKETVRNSHHAYT